MRIAAVSPAAAALGIAGLTLADARARVPELAVVAHDPAADARLLDWLADGCEVFSPAVALAPPDAILIDVTGCSGAFGSEAALVAALRRRVAAHRLQPVTAVAATPDAALALARHGPDGDVAVLPVTALAVAAEVHTALRRAGLTTIGALAIRPRGPLAARFGTEAATRLARLLGEEDAPLVPRRIPPAIRVVRRFAEPVASQAMIRDTLDGLVRDASLELEHRHAGGRRFEATLFRSDGHVARLAIDTATPTRDPVVVSRLIAERIDGLADPLDPGFGYDVVTLTVPVVQPVAARQLGLYGDDDATTPVAALVDRLTTRLGSARVRRLVRGDSHLPEQASFDLPVASPLPTAWPDANADEPPRRPLHLFTPPEPIEVLAEVPDGPPRWFRWRRLRRDVARFEGPERIAAEWWRDGDAATRDYYRVEDAHGRRYWVFRNGLYGVETVRPGWFLHGLFA